MGVLRDGWKEDGSDLTERGLVLEIFITVDAEGWVTTINRGAPCEDFSKMREAYKSAVREINEFIERGTRDCPFSDAPSGETRMLPERREGVKRFSR